MAEAAGSRAGLAGASGRRGFLLLFARDVWYNVTLPGGVLVFDGSAEPQGACRGADYLVNTAANFIVAEDDNLALAA